MGSIGGRTWCQELSTREYACCRYSRLYRSTQGHATSLGQLGTANHLKCAPKPCFPKYTATALCVHYCKPPSTYLIGVERFHTALEQIVDRLTLVGYVYCISLCPARDTMGEFRFRLVPENVRANLRCGVSRANTPPLPQSGNRMKTCKNQHL